MVDREPTFRKWKRKYADLPEIPNVGDIVEVLSLPKDTAKADSSGNRAVCSCVKSDTITNERGQVIAPKWILNSIDNKGLKIIIDNCGGDNIKRVEITGHSGSKKSIRGKVVPYKGDKK